MTRTLFSFGPLIACLLVTTGAQAEVAESTAQGFSISESAHVAATPDALYAAIIHPEKWWNAAHSFSHDTKNLSLDARAGGCFCETLPNGGSVQHLAVIFASPGKTLRLKGAMGPFQGQGLEGTLTFSLAPKDGGSDLQLDYNIGGFMKGGFGKMPQAADGMMTDLVAHLKFYAENGKAMPASPPAK